MTPCASLRVRLAVEPHTDQSASLTVRTHQARLGSSTRSSSCASNPNVAHASLRGKQMPAKMTYSGVALNERGPSFRIQRQQRERIPALNHHGRGSMQLTVRRASAPGWKEYGVDSVRDRSPLRERVTSSSVCQSRTHVCSSWVARRVEASCASPVRGRLLDSGLSRMVHKFGTFPLGKGRRPELVCR